MYPILPVHVAVVQFDHANEHYVTYPRKTASFVQKLVRNKTNQLSERSVMDCCKEGV